MIGRCCARCARSIPRGRKFHDNCMAMIILGRAMRHLQVGNWMFDAGHREAYELLLEKYRMVERPDRVCSLCHNHMAQAGAPWCQYCDDLAHESI